MLPGPLSGWEPGNEANGSHDSRCVDNLVIGKPWLVIWRLHSSSCPDSWAAGLGLHVYIHLYTWTTSVVTNVLLPRLWNCLVAYLQRGNHWYLGAVLTLSLARQLFLENCIPAVLVHVVPTHHSCLFAVKLLANWEMFGFMSLLSMWLRLQWYNVYMFANS